MRSERQMTRRAAVTRLAAAPSRVLGYALRGAFGSPGPSIRLIDDGNGMMGVSPTDMSRYMEMFNRHNEITRTVEEIPGGIRTTTQSASPELAAQLKAHVSSMYSQLEQGARSHVHERQPADAFPALRRIPPSAHAHAHRRDR